MTNISKGNILPHSDYIRILQLLLLNMSAPWLKKLCKLCSYKIILYFCLSIVLLNFYIGLTFYGYQDQVSDDEEPSLGKKNFEDFHFQRQQVYKKSASFAPGDDGDVVKEENDDEKQKSLQLSWDPDKLRKSVRV